MVFGDATVGLLTILLALLACIGISSLLASLFSGYSSLVLSKGGGGGGGVFKSQPAPQIIASPQPAPAPAAAPPAPSGPSEAEKAAAAEEEKKKKKQAAGGTVLTGSLGVTDEGVADKKTLLGA